MNKTIIVYFSYTNHTKEIAEKIQRTLNCDMLELHPETPYSTDYNTLVAELEKEENRVEIPKIKPINKNLEEYDTIILGTPVWWYTCAPVIRTFLTETNLANKKIIPYATNAGWLGTTLEDIKKLSKGATIEHEMNIVYTTDYAENKLVTKESEIMNWLATIQ